MFDFMYARLTPLWVVGLIATSSCSSDDDPLTRESFCNEWATRACSSEVISVCQATTPDACKESQATHCLSLVPESFTAQAADVCLDAVQAAYKDADLTRQELDTVLALGAPCDELAKGSQQGGETCEDNADCETPRGFRCVIKGGEREGTCQVPEEVGPGLKCAEPQQTCSDGFFCNGSNCVEALTVGEACVNHAECGLQRFCADSECAERFELNAECSFDEQCGSGICYSGATMACVDRVRLSPSEPLCQQLR